MKNLILLLMLLLVFSSCFADNLPVDPSDKIFLGVVVDASPTSDKKWNIRKSRAIELLSTLESGDKVVVVKARSGRPSVCARAVVGGPEKTGLNEMTSAVSVLGKEWFSPADVGSACKTMRDIFLSEGKGCHFCLVVLTNGRLSRNQVNDIVEVIDTLQKTDRSICFTYDPAVASDNLITASKTKDFEIRLDSNPTLTYWLQSVRKTLRGDQQNSRDYNYKVIVEPNLSTFAKILDQALLSMVPEPDEVKAPQTVEAPTMTITQPAPVEKPEEVRKPPEKVSVKQGKLKWLIGIVDITFSLLLLGVVWLWLYQRFPVKQPNDVRTSEQPQGVVDSIETLKAVMGEKDMDLGPVDLISELTIGSDPGCSLFIEDEGLAVQQARIFRTKKGFKIQNIDSLPMSVNGVSVQCRQKISVSFPVEIELPSGLMISLFTESVSAVQEAI